MDNCFILYICFISTGHLLGLSHDDSKFCEENFGSMEDKRLMSSILTSIDASKPWSKCTSATITEFFDDGHGMYLLLHTLCIGYMSVFAAIHFCNKNILCQIFLSLLIFRTILEVLAKQRESLKDCQGLTPTLHGSNAQEKNRVDGVCAGSNLFWNRVFCFFLF